MSLGKLDAAGMTRGLWVLLITFVALASVAKAQNHCGQDFRYIDLSGDYAGTYYNEHLGQRYYGSARGDVRLERIEHTTYTMVVSNANVYLNIPNGTYSLWFNPQGRRFFCEHEGILTNLETGEERGLVLAYRSGGIVALQIGIGPGGTTGAPVSSWVELIPND